MPEHLRALGVIFVLALITFRVVRPMAIELLPEDTFRRWRNLWLLMTVLLFLAHSYWVYGLVVAMYALVVLRREAQIVGLYFLLLFVAPPARVEVPGFGLVNYIFALNQYRLLALVVLLPVAISLTQRGSTLRLGRSPVDWMVLGYLVLLSVLQFRDANLTSGLRNLVTNVVDIFLPYYVVSRSLRDLNDFRHALTGFVLGAMVLAVLAAFEVLRTWKLYFPLLGALGLNPREFGGYLFRGSLLRPDVSVGGSIVLGYVVMVALGYFLYLRHSITSRFQLRLGFLLLAGGVLASLSRGPWVGALFMFVVFLATGPGAMRKLFRLSMAGVVVAVLLNFVPGGRAFLDLLPFVGTVDEFNVEYRANLLTAAMPVIERNLWLGSVDFLKAPELQVMIQGDGIIDIVNSYIGVTLEMGLAGLFFFVGMFVQALRRVRQAYRRAVVLGEESQLLGRALFAVLGGIALVIYTVSGVTAVPIVYWTAVAIGVAYAAYVDRALAAHRPEP
ncbi:MAG: O-antigen ligase family protein [Burkholderiaceae bacterium]